MRANIADGKLLAGDPSVAFFVARAVQRLGPCQVCPLTVTLSRKHQEDISQ